jgi:hypothetical protein
MTIAKIEIRTLTQAPVADLPRGGFLDMFLGVDVHVKPIKATAAKP